MLFVSNRTLNGNYVVSFFVKRHELKYLLFFHIQNNQKHFRIWMWIDKTLSNSSLILNTYHSGTCVNNNRTEPDLLDIIQLSSNPVLNSTIQLISSPQVYFSPNYVCLPFLIVFNSICLLFLVFTLKPCPSSH